MRVGSPFLFPVPKEGGRKEVAAGRGPSLSPLSTIQMWLQGREREGRRLRCCCCLSYLPVSHIWRKRKGKGLTVHPFLFFFSLRFGLCTVPLPFLSPLRFPPFFLQERDHYLPADGPPPPSLLLPSQLFSPRRFVKIMRGYLILESVPSLLLPFPLIPSFQKSKMKIFCSLSLLPLPVPLHGDKGRMATRGPASSRRIFFLPSFFLFPQLSFLYKQGKKMRRNTRGSPPSPFFLFLDALSTERQREYLPTEVRPIGFFSPPFPSPFSLSFSCNKLRTWRTRQDS